MGIMLGATPNAGMLCSINYCDEEKSSAKRITGVSLVTWKTVVQTMNGSDEC